MPKIKIEDKQKLVQKIAKENKISIPEAQELYAKLSQKERARQVQQMHMFK